MARISKEVLFNERDQFLNHNSKLKQFIGDVVTTDFGQYMNDKYLFHDEALKNEKDFEKAYERIKEKHVQV
ncbi:MAG: hypothetical protein CM15mV42_1960 [uncultured marine virus]|nr:MAG: hypothetical protein CM15mV42_1960 [uncultured marine virus]